MTPANSPESRDGTWGIAVAVSAWFRLKRLVKRLELLNGRKLFLRLRDCQTSGERGVEWAP